jgi:hypothetical protein
MKVMFGARAPGEVDAYWCHEPGKKWTRVPRQHLELSALVVRNTSGKFVFC